MTGKKTTAKNHVKPATLREYFAALANFYGIVTLREAAQLLREQYGEPVSEEDILKFAESELEKDSHHYYIVDPRDPYSDSAKDVSPDWQIVQCCFLEIDDDFYEKMQEQIDGMDFYIPTKSELLKYVDGYYAGWSDSAQLLMDFLEQNIQIINPMNTMREIVEEYIFGAKLGEDDSLEIDSLLFYLRAPRSNQAKRKFIKQLQPLATAARKDTRVWRYRGHTMNEMSGKTTDAARPARAGATNQPSVSESPAK